MTDAIGRNRPERGRIRTVYAKRVSDKASMLVAGTAETIEQLFGDIVATVERDILDGASHVFDGNSDKALGSRFLCSAVADLTGKCSETLTHNGGIEQSVLGRAKDHLDDVGWQLSEHNVCVHHGERAARVEAAGAGISAGGIGPCAEAASL